MSTSTFNGQLVLISGVNGYIASQTARAFLEAGYCVRGTARSTASGEELKKVLQSYVDAGRFEIVEVKDIVAEGAFDEVVKGCHAIAHMASPTSQFFTDPDPIIKAAVGGTLSILRSALKHGGSTLKSFVHMSSIAAIIEPKATAHVFTEADWNNFSEPEAFWKFREDHDPSFTMSAINPVYVCGPPLVLPKDPANINETVHGIYQILSGGPLPEPLGGSGAFVDVRDVADMMVFGVDHPDKANGERFIVAAGVGGMQTYADVLNKHYPERNLVKGEPGTGYLPDYSFPGGVIDSSKAVKPKGKEWIGFEKSVLDSAKAFEIYL